MFAFAESYLTSDSDHNIIGTGNWLSTLKLWTSDIHTDAFRASSNGDNLQEYSHESTECEELLT